MADKPRGYVRISYRLDGSGQAIDPAVTASVPPRVFDQEVLSALLRTRFKPGVVATDCVWIADFGTVTRRSSVMRLL